jgi:hypothetical protein
LRSLQYLVPKPARLVTADVKESPFTRRGPGTVIYGRPGDWLRIHVKNADITPHDFHLNDVRYPIDSDASWPFGAQSDEGGRPNEIGPGQKCTYVLQITEENTHPRAAIRARGLTHLTIGPRMGTVFIRGGPLG